MRLVTLAILRRISRKFETSNDRDIALHDPPTRYRGIPIANPTAVGRPTSHQRAVQVLLTSIHGRNGRRAKRPWFCRRRGSPLASTGSFETASSPIPARLGSRVTSCGTSRGRAPRREHAGGGRAAHTRWRRRPDGALRRVPTFERGTRRFLCHDFRDEPGVDWLCPQSEYRTPRRLPSTSLQVIAIILQSENSAETSGSRSAIDLLFTINIIIISFFLFIANCYYYTFSVPRARPSTVCYAAIVNRDFFFFWFCVVPSRARDDRLLRHSPPTIPRIWREYPSTTIAWPSRFARRCRPRIESAAAIWRRRTMARGRRRDSRPPSRRPRLARACPDGAAARLCSRRQKPLDPLVAYGRRPPPCRYVVSYTGPGTLTRFESQTQPHAIKQPPVKIEIR